MTAALSQGCANADPGLLPAWGEALGTDSATVDVGHRSAQAFRNTSGGRVVFSTTKLQRALVADVEPIPATAQE